MEKRKGGRFVAGSNAAATLDFPCAPRAVWDVLVTPDLYERWFAPAEGFAGGEELTLGAKIRFVGRSTTYVVTVFEPQYRLELTSGRRTEEFLVKETSGGCRVTMTTTGPATLVRETAEHGVEMLEKLKDTAATNVAREAKKGAKARKGARLNDIISGVLQGYRTPIEHRENLIEESEELSQAIDISEADVRVQLRGAIAALICVVLLFSTLAFTGRFERGDVVPSSGLSVKQSDDVNKDNASLIEIGQSQRSLELMINCVGERLSPTQFYYCSVDTLADGRPAAEMYVIYDAYGATRSVLFVDNEMAARSFERPYIDPLPVVTADMTPVEVEQEVGRLLSAFWLDRSGGRTVYFGVFSAAQGNVDYNTRAQFVVRSDAAQQMVDYAYYMEPDPENPLAVDVLTQRLKRQYTNTDIYMNDSAAFERIFLLQGGSRYDADIVLGRGNVEYTPLEKGQVLCTYRGRNAAAGDEGTRYLYNVTVNHEEWITEIVYINRYLETREDMLSADGYALETGMSLYEVYDELGILPSCARLRYGELTLCYGNRINEREDITEAYALVVVLETETMTVTEVLTRRP